MFIVCLIIRLIINSIGISDGNGIFTKHVISIIIQVTCGGATYFGMLYVFRDKYFYMIVNKISMKILKREVI